MLDGVTICAGRRELDTSSRRLSEMARSWRSLYPAVDYSELMMMMNDISYKLKQVKKRKETERIKGER
jgi:Zn/Cd-binding protein ZinT